MCPFRCARSRVCVNACVCVIVDVSRYLWCEIGATGYRLDPASQNQLTGVINPNGNVDKALLGLADISRTFKGNFSASFVKRLLGPDPVDGPLQTVRGCSFAMWYCARL